ncbi:MAG: phosphonate transport system ATP-binding protein, partial [Myxococcota bacterium]
RALYQRPAVLLADEPVSSLDPARAEDTLQWLVELGRTEGLGLVVSLHDVELARRCLPRLLLLREGRVEHDGRPDALPQP